MDEEPIVRCAKAWRDTIQIALQDLNTVPHLMVKYEDLVSSPEEIACTVLDYLGLKNHLSVLEFCKKIQNSTRDSYHAQRQVHLILNQLGFSRLQELVFHWNMAGGYLAEHLQYLPACYQKILEIDQRLMGKWQSKEPRK